jgi:hypothetical protein
VIQNKGLVTGFCDNGDELTGSIQDTERPD